MFGRQVLTVKLPAGLAEEAARVAAGATGKKPDGRRTAATAVGFLLELYLVHYPDVLHHPPVRGQNPEPGEQPVCISVGEELAELLDRHMLNERARLEQAWRDTPRACRKSRRPPKPEYRGLVIAAIREGVLTRCYGCA